MDSFALRSHRATTTRVGEQVTQDATSEQPAARGQDRRVFSLTTGARICLIVGALLLVFAGYLFWAPVGQSVPSGFPAKCGSAAASP